jgi:hypothetical protein
MEKKVIITEKQLEVIVKHELSELLKTDEFVKKLINAILAKSESEKQLLTD